MTLHNRSINFILAIDNYTCMKYFYEIEENTTNTLLGTDKIAF